MEKLFKLSNKNKKLVNKILNNHGCGNFIDGNCIECEKRLGEVMPVVCPQLNNSTLNCRHFKAVVLHDSSISGTAELLAAYLSANGSVATTVCAVCGKPIIKTSNRTKYCTRCKAAARKKQQNMWKKNKLLEIAVR